MGEGANRAHGRCARARAAGVAPVLRALQARGRVPAGEHGGLGLGLAIQERGGVVSVASARGGWTYVEGAAGRAGASASLGRDLRRKVLLAGALCTLSLANSRPAATLAVWVVVVASTACKHQQRESEVEFQQVSGGKRVQARPFCTRCRHRHPCRPRPHAVIGVQRVPLSPPWCSRKSPQPGAGACGEARQPGRAARAVRRRRPQALHAVMLRLAQDHPYHVLQSLFCLKNGALSLFGLALLPHSLAGR